MDMEIQSDAATIASAVLDEGRQQKAREYARIRRRLTFVNLGFGALCIVVMLGFGLDHWLRNLLAPLGAWQPVPGWRPLQILLYFVILIVIYELLTLPLGYYSGYILPHRYGLSTMKLSGWIADLLKGFGLGLVLEACALELI